MSDVGDFKDVEMTEDEFDRAFSAGVPVTVVVPTKQWSVQVSSRMTYTASPSPASFHRSGAVSLGGVAVSR